MHDGEVTAVSAVIVREFYLRNDWTEFEYM